MWRWLKNLVGADAPALDEESGAPPEAEGDDPAAPRPEAPPPWPSRCDTLVLYEVAGDGEPPDTRSESLVVEYIDPVDQLVTFGAEAAPSLVWWEERALQARLEAARERGGLRDPNSPARLHWASRWMREREGGWVAAQLEPGAIAGNGTAYARGRQEDPGGSDIKPVD
ncbi:MAG: hypothetical protein CMH57_00650 [Myxococcales bacterium]|nr:hypothetical protein [Myxococcales bacterium]